MVDAAAHPPGVGRKIIDAIRHRSAEFLDQKVVHPDLFRAPLRPILAAMIAEVADQLLLLGVDRNRRLLFGQSCGHLGVDMGELRIPVGVPRADREIPEGAAGRLARALSGRGLLLPAG